MTILLLSPILYIAWYTDRKHKQNRCNHANHINDKCIRCGKEKDIKNYSNK